MSDPNQPIDQATINWQQALATLIAEIDAAHSPEAEAAVMTRVAALDPGLQSFLVERMAEQDSPEAVAFLEALAALPATPDAVRAQAQLGLAALAKRGIVAPAAGTEHFYAGWVQQGRERGEQIMLLGWRLPDNRLEGLVFLLDWRGDGLKDFYRTREISDAEWQQLVEHNGQKGAPLTAIELPEGRALLEAVLAEGRRFSRPLPREYKLAHPVIERRVLAATALPAKPRQYVTPDLEPAAVVVAYVEALHYRDYLLAWELLAPAHPMRGSGSQAEAVDAMRRELKHAPRRRPDVTTTPDQSPPSASDTVRLVAEGDEEQVERGGRRVRQAVRERYTLRRMPDGWRIGAIERLV